LVTRLRGKINVVVKQEYGEEKVHYTEPIIEEPERCIQAFYTLMRGHAVIKGRTQVTADDLPVVIDVALSSAPWDRTFAFAYLLNKEKVTTNELMEDLPCSRYKAIRTMQTLRLLDLVTLEEEKIESYGGKQIGYIMKLKPDFKWFATEEFKRLWRMKLSDIVKPAEELTEAEAKKAEKEAIGLEPFVKIFTRRMRRIHMRRKRC
jgi:predicted transcriptional regulator